MVNIDTFYVKARGRRLRAKKIAPRIAPEQNPPALVFLHEGLGSIPQWRDFPAGLVNATGLPALVYERCGHGGSDPLTLPRTVNYLHEEALESLPEILEQCGMKDAILIGHNDGGSIALIFAAEHPHLARAVVTLAAHVFVEEETIKGIREAVKAFETSGLKKRLARHHGVKTEALFRAWCDTWLSPEFRVWNIETYLPKIRCPLLVIQGKDDEYATAAQVEAIARQVSGPVETLMIPGCAHVPHQQARELVLKEMAKFILS